MGPESKDDCADKDQHQIPTLLTLCRVNNSVGMVFIPSVITFVQLVQKL
jgi:hypothetical protein